jgi:hypothetical protein
MRPRFCSLKGLIGFDPGYGFKINYTDFTNVTTSLGIKVSCQKLAEAYNSAISVNGCFGCYRFICEEGKTPYEIGLKEYNSIPDYFK